MMRYQGLSPDNLPLSNGRRSHWRTCKEEDDIIGTRDIDEGNKGIPKFRSPSPKTQDQIFTPYSSNGSVQNSLSQSKNNHHHHETNNSSSPIHNGGGSGDVLLQWGHRKRSRCSRTTDSRPAAAGGTTVTTDDSSSSSSTQMKVQRRSISLPTAETKNTTGPNIMPPPTTISITAGATKTSAYTSNGKNGNLKSCSKDNPTFVNSRRNMEERSGGGSGSHPPRNSGSSRAGVAASSSRSKVGKRSPSKVIEKNDHKRSITSAPSSGSVSLRSDDKLNGGGIGMNHHNTGSIPPQEAGCSTTTTTTNHHRDDNITSKSAMVVAEKAANGGGAEVNEWPRIYIPLTRKEKEEDFFAMKGTKLPHRPKKRPKTVDRMLQYCFPGLWLADVTRARYEVKEKKCNTKKAKRRGLKGMESMDSDSE